MNKKVKGLTLDSVRSRLGYGREMYIPRIKAYCSADTPPVSTFPGIAKHSKSLYL